MRDVTEVVRRVSPAPKPQSIAVEGATLWMGSRETRRVYAMDRATLTVRDEYVAPGTPWGMTFAGDGLRFVLGERGDDTRMIRRFTPNGGFSDDAIPCPDDTGSQLSFDGERLYVSQWYNKRLLEIGPAGAVGRTIDVPHEICGQTFVAGTFYLVTTDDETTTDYFLTRVDVSGPDVRTDDIARIGFSARGLAYDGELFWTNHRDADQIVAFRAPL